jgi:hypothetical protein
MVDPNPIHWRFDKNLKCKVCYLTQCSCWKKQIWCVKFILLKDDIELADCISFVPKKLKTQKTRKVIKCENCSGCIICLLDINKIIVSDCWIQTKTDKISRLGQFVWSRIKKKNHSSK